MIDVANESGDPLADAEPRCDETALAACARHALDQMRVHRLADLAILLVDEATMASLHEKWLDEPGPTDVMSFPADELRPGRPGGEPVEGTLGDIVLCPAVARRQAAAAGHAPGRELLLLTVHGVLHLLGFDHAEPDDEREMFALQERLLGEYLESLPRTGRAGP